LEDSLPLVGQTFPGSVSSIIVDPTEANFNESPPFTIIIRGFGYTSSLTRYFSYIADYENNYPLCLALKGGEIILNVDDAPSSLLNVQTGIFVQGKTKLR
jgi:hypothetical protein